MSGPKLMELRRLRREARRQHNQDRCDGFDVEYPRLFAEFQALCNRLGSLGEVARNTLKDPADAASDAAEALRNNRDDEAVKTYGRYVLSAREEIEAARRRVAARLVELRERHRMAGSDLHRLREEREALLSMLENLVSGRLESDSTAPAAFREAMERLRAVPCPDPIAWGHVAVDDAAALARAESCLNQFQDELKKGRALVEELLQQSGETKAANGASASQTTSFSEYWAKRGPTSSGPEPVVQDPGAPFPSFEALLKQAAALPAPDLYHALCGQVAEIELVADSEARRLRGEVLMIQGVQQIRERKKLLRFREEVQSMLDQAVPFAELAADPFMGELRDLLSATVVSDLNPLQKRHAEILDQARARREREAKRQALLDSLRELGYQANENMQTAFTDSGRLVVHKRDENEYAIELVADASFDKVQTAMLRYSGSSEMSEQQRLRDREHEASWCGDHGKLRRLMEQRGWESDLKMQRPPGEHPVRVVVDPARGRRQEGSREPKVAAQDLT